MKFQGLLWFFCAVGLFSQELPPIQNYAPSDYHGENQNWAISQSKTKLVYAANNKGLLEFNGAKWTRYPSPNATIIRSVRAIGDKIYSGCYREFGYWQKDGYGILRYISLSSRLNLDFLPDEEFWNILDMDDWIVFQSKSRIYVYNVVDESVYTIDSANPLPKIFNVGQNLYFQRFNEGIFKIQNGKDVLVFDDLSVLEDEVVGIFGKEQGLLILTRHKGFFKTEAGSMAKWEISADGLLSTMSIYSVLQLKDKGFALGTISSGLLLLDENGNILYHIDRTNGLGNNTVLSLLEDNDDNIWLGLDNGISYLDLKSPFRVYHDSEGVVGSVYAAMVRDSMLYLGTNQGLFYRNSRNNCGFVQVQGTQGQVWAMYLKEDTLFCAHHTGTFVVEGDRAKKIVDVPGTWNVGELSGHPGHLLQGNYDGL